MGTFESFQVVTPRTTLAVSGSSVLREISF